MYKILKVDFVEVLVAEIVHFLIKIIATKFGFYRALLTTVTLELKIAKESFYVNSTNGSSSTI